MLYKNSFLSFNDIEYSNRATHLAPDEGVEVLAGHKVSKYQHD